MMRFKKAVGLALLVAFVVSGVAMAQGIPTGRLSGRVSDSDGNGVPEVAVEISSPALQGVRTTTTDLNGDYVVPSLPPGEYTATYTMDGFDTQSRTTRLASSQALQVDVDMSIAAVTETIEVTGEAATVISKDNTNANTVSQDVLEELPGGRTVALAAPSMIPSACAPTAKVAAKKSGSNG